MADPVPVPTAAEALVDDVRKPTSTWYRVLKRLIDAFNEAAGNAAGGLGTKLAQGTHSIWVPATAMLPRTTNGPEPVTVDLPSSGLPLTTLDFDQSTQETAHFLIGMPKSWDEGAIAVEIYWTAASGSGNVNWFVSGHAAGNDDAIDASFSNFGGAVDTFLAASDVHIITTSAFTPSGSPADGDLVDFAIGRNAADGSDTFTADAKLIGVKLLYGVNAGNDA
jgi:hypothetical protein